MSKFNKKAYGLLAAFLFILLSICSVALISAVADTPDLQNTYYTVNVESDNTAYGTVTVTGNYAHPDNPNQFLIQTPVTVTATPKPGYKLVRWEGSTDIGTAATSFTVNSLTSDLTYTAYFAPCEYTIEFISKTWDWEEGQTIPSVHVFGTSTLLPIMKSDGTQTFRGWLLVEEGKPREEWRLYNPGEQLGPNEFKSNIKLEASFAPTEYNVTCYDKTASGATLGIVVIRSHFGATGILGCDAPEATYRGYYFLKDYCEYGELAEVTANPETNVVDRIYNAKTYKIIYVDCEMPAEARTLHTYGVNTPLDHHPSKEGWIFVGWEIVNYDATLYNFTSNKLYISGSNPIITISGDAYDNPTWTYENRASDDVAIVLRPLWEPESYSVQYEDIDAAHKDQLPTERYYNQDFTLPNDLTRAGYTFLGWKIKGSDADFVKDFVLPANASSQNNLVFVAGWEANSYHVTLDPDAAEASGGDAAFDAVFGQALPSIAVPQRPGYTFAGYFSGKGGSGKAYFDANGVCVAGTVWDIATESPVLYAHWIINSYTVTVDQTILDGATVTVNGQAYNGSPLSFDYMTPITVVVSVNGNCKLVSWNGQAIAHTANYTAPSFDLTANVNLTGVIALMMETPAFGVNYRDEIFTGGSATQLPAGTYRVICGSQTLNVVVAENGSITLPDQNQTGSKLSLTPYLGETVQIVRCGDGVTTADSDAQVIFIASRSGKPLRNQHFDYVAALDYSIEIYMIENRDLYEYACSLTPSPDGDSGLVWSDTPFFGDLKAGTPYYVYIRLKATDTAPHGEAHEERAVTLPGQYLQTQIDRLNNLKQQGDGENVNKLIDEAISKMQALAPSTDFVDLIEEIYDEAAEAILFARVQDNTISELRALCKNLKESGAYSEEKGIKELETHLASAIAAINSAKTANEVQLIFNNTKKDFDSVLISYVYFGDNFKLFSANGLDKDFKLSASRVEDLSVIASQIRAAIEAGTIVVGGTQMTLAGANDALQTLDVLAYYHMQLTHSNLSAVAKPSGSFEIRLLIPEGLRSRQGWLVAYYESNTQELTVLDTRREGNYLIFTADSIGDFVILGDHNVKLTGYLAALCAVIACQIVAIAMLLIRRRRYAKEIRCSASLLPLAALTIRFVPVGAIRPVMVLAGIAVILQIVLLYLLLTSDLIFRRKKKAVENVPGRATPQSAVPVAESIPIVAETAEGKSESDVPSNLEIPMTRIFESDNGEEDAEPDWYGDGEFIEPAAVPHYSLPDEGDASEPEQKDEIDSIWDEEVTEEAFETEEWENTPADGEDTFWDEETEAETIETEEWVDAPAEEDGFWGEETEPATEATGEWVDAPAEEDDFWGEETEPTTEATEEWVDAPAEETEETAMESDSEDGESAEEEDEPTTRYYRYD